MSDTAQHDQSRIEHLCAKAGLRMTAPRRAIARVLSSASDHPDVEELHRRVLKLDPKISLSTVYRTLRLLEQKGILERHDFSTGRSHYETTSTEHHDHLINVRTGKVTEFRCDDIERLQERIAHELGFKLVGHRLELYGVPLKSKRKRGS